MTPERWQQIDQLFEAALEREPSQREAFLDQACAGDEALRRDVESLLVADERGSHFIEPPAIEVAAELLAGDEAEPMVGQCLGPYKILSQLGGGGMGNVYLAEDARLGRQVAVKVLAPALVADRQSRTRFLREARLASALDHPNICAIHGVDEARGHYFISMQYVEGDTLKQVIGGRPLGLDSLLSISLQVADVLRAAHAQGIIHRDIKSNNIMITAGGQAKVLDFGLAKLLEPEMGGAAADLTRTGATLGTPSYMSPEQAQGKRVDHRSDIFSFGVVLYEMATGRTPFKRKSQAETMNAVINDTAIPVSEINQEVPRGLSALIDRALAKDQGDRYQSMHEMLGDLRQIVAQSESLRQLLSPAEVPDGIIVPYVTARRPNWLGRWQRWIQRRGHRWTMTAIASVIIVALGVGAYLLRGHGQSIDSVAVLPLENLSGDPAQDYFTDGMTEALITDLAQISALRVISRTSVMRYKGTRKPMLEIARELKVDAVVEGSVLRSGDRVRITAQLIEAATDGHLWAKNYERDMRDVLTLQSEVAQAIASEIKVRLTPQEQMRLASARPVKPEAHEAYLKGRYHWDKITEEETKKAIEYFNQAIQSDPSCALAYAGLADCYSYLVLFGSSPPKETFPKAKAAAMKAVELDETLAAAHSALGKVRLFFDWDLAASEREFKRGIELNSGDAGAHEAYALYLRAAARLDEALAEVKRAQELDPLSIYMSVNVAWVLQYLRRNDEAISVFRTTLEMDPTYGNPHSGIARAYEQRGMYQEAIAELEKGNLDFPSRLGTLGHIYALMGNRREAEKLLDGLRSNPLRTLDVAYIYMGLGQKDLAFEWLEKAYEARSPWLVFDLKPDPRFDSLRSDPRYTDLLRRLGLPP